MTRSYRRILFALVGWFILTAEKPQTVSLAAKEHQPSLDIKEAAESIAQAIRETNRPVEQDSVCFKGKDKRKSELCAQWEAADAASDAAEYAFWTLLVSCTGTLLLVWTLWETRQTTTREQRAYVRVEHKNGVVQPNKPILLLIEIINYGATPARRLVSANSVVVRSTGWDWSDECQSSIIEQRPDGGLTVHPGTPHMIKSGIGDPLPRGTFDAIMSGQLAIYCRGFVEYEDVFGKRRKTTFQFEFHGEDKGDGTNGLMRVSQRGNDAT